VADLGQRATGMEVEWFREGLANPSREDAYWVAGGYADGVGKLTAPVQLIGGWQDIFLPWMLEDVAALQAAGRQAQLIIGPWTHTAPGLTAAALREGLAWLRAGLLGDDRLVRPGAVQLYVTGERTGGGWRRLLSWPPPDSGEWRLWLGARGEPRTAPPAGVSWNVCDALIRAAPDRFESVGDGAWRVAFALWPTAHRFATGHRIRLQVSSGAHPRYLRNPGTGEDPTIATSMEPVDIEILHDERHPSVLILPA